MNWRHVATWCSGLALIGMGATLLRGQPPQPLHDVAVRVDREKLRAEVVKLRTEVEMLRFDYELARDGLLEELKIARGLRMAGGMMGAVAAIQTAMNQAGTNSPDVAQRQPSEQDKKKAAEEAKAAEQEEKKQTAAEAAYIAEQKKELNRFYALLAARRIDLEDAEQRYRETAR